MLIFGVERISNKGTKNYDNDNYNDNCFCGVGI